MHAMNNSKHIEILYQLWNLKDYQASIDLAWRWYELEILSLETLVDFASELLRQEQELSNQELYCLEDFLQCCARIKIYWDE